MPDDMFFSDDARSLRRGRRIATRTPTCRPCLLWPKDDPTMRVEGVVMNVNPHGCLIRSLHHFPVGTLVEIQIMRDDEFSQPLSILQEGEIRRHDDSVPGFTDHGIKLLQKTIPRFDSRPAERPKLRQAPRRVTRMHTRDLRNNNRRTGR
jgi:hypothetical protein